MKIKRLNKTFFTRNDVITISKELLGKVLVTNHNGVKTSGMITETEAYMGPLDRASHAYNNKRTKRTETMFLTGGIAYVYLCYGMHSLFNVVTNKKDIPHAILIRALKPIDGVDVMLKRRKLSTVSKKLTAGPGILTKALNISMQHNGLSLIGSNIWIEDRGFDYSNPKIDASPRIGIDYAGEDAKLPWRFTIKDNTWLSKGILLPLQF